MVSGHLLGSNTRLLDGPSDVQVWIFLYLYSLPICSLFYDNVRWTRPRLISCRAVPMWKAELGVRGWDIWQTKHEPSNRPLIHHLPLTKTI